MTKASGTAEEQRAIEYLRWTGWLQDHDRQIYEQGKRDGIEERKTGKWIPSYGNVKCSVCGTVYDCKRTECKSCPMYDREKHYCPKWCEVILNAIEDAKLEKMIKDCERHLNCKGCPHEKECEWIWQRI